MSTIIKLKNVNSNFAFDAIDENNNIVKIDANLEIGGKNYGTRPMKLLLMGLGGCSGIDIVNILKKQRQEITFFEIEIKGKREKGKDVSLWETITIVFKLNKSIDIEKAQKACDLSMKKYCSVAETLRLSGSNINYVLEMV